MLTFLEAIVFFKIPAGLEIEFDNELNCNSEKNDGNAKELEWDCLVSVVQDANQDSKYLPGGDNEGDNMLLEVVDHPIYEHLPDRGQHAHYYQVDRKQRSLKDKDELV